MRQRIHIGLMFLLLATLACGVAPRPSANQPNTDNNPYRYDNLPEGAVNKAGIAEYRAISKWDITDITYAFLNGTDDIQGNRGWQDVRDAFGIWAAQTPLTFTETNDANQADIVVSWETGDHGDGDPFDGPGDVLAHASYPNPYQREQVILHFDDDETWADNPPEDVDLVTVAAHEIGHTLGLDHSRDPNSLM